MARTRVTPRIGVSGLYTANEPFTLSSEHTYNCIAIRRFLDIEREGINVFETYYAPKELDQSIKAEDEEMDTCIITLLRSDGLMEFVPDTFITAYPLLEGLKYARVSMMVDCGIVRDNVDFNTVQTKIVNFIKEVVNPPSVKVSMVLLPVKNTISIADQDALEAVRLQNVNAHKTDYAKMRALELEVASLKIIIQNQNQQLIDAGVNQGN